MKNLYCYGLIVSIFCTLSQHSFAAKAGLILHPTQLFISEDQRNQTVRVINNGDATGVFEISWVDYVMNPDGGFVPWSGENSAAWSLQDKVRYSPRRVTLAPGESQNIKIMIHRKASSPSNEYYSHLKVIIANANVDDEVEEELTTDATSIEVKTRSGISIPVIWRNQNVEPRANIPEASVNWTDQLLELKVERHSGISTRGYVHILSSSKGSKPIPVLDPIHLVIYPSVDYRLVSIPMAKSGVKQGDRLIFVYSEQLDSMGEELARYEMQL